MPRPAKAARLWLESASTDAQGRVTVRSMWVILDRGRKHRTGCLPQELGEAERKLQEYLVKKHDPAADRDRDPRTIFIADILSLYLSEVATRHARPKETGARLSRLAEFLGAKRLAVLNSTLTKAYADHRGSPAAARRELEDLRSAIGHYHKPFLAQFPIVMPAAGDERSRWLTRSEAARLIWAAWTMRQGYGENNRRFTGKHIARAILVGLYTGTRIGAICGAAIRPTVGKGYVDLEVGLFHRRPPGSKESKKRQPPIRLHGRILAHMRRWERLGISKRFLIEWNGKSVARINKAFRAVRERAEFGPEIVPHTLRHTAATWMMQNGECTPQQAAGYLGMTIETMDRVYAHHHPDHQENAKAAIGGRPKRPETKAKAKAANSGVSK